MKGYLFFNLKLLSVQSVQQITNEMLCFFFTCAEQESFHLESSNISPRQFGIFKETQDFELKIKYLSLGFELLLQIFPPSLKSDSIFSDYMHTGDIIICIMC